MGKKNRTVCPKCGSKVGISKLKFSGRNTLIQMVVSSFLKNEVLAGGWLSKILKGLACPKCGEIIGKPED